MQNGRILTVRVSPRFVLCVDRSISFGLFSLLSVVVKYTDIDYVVYTDAARFVSQGCSILTFLSRICSLSLCLVSGFLLFAAQHIVTHRCCMIKCFRSCGDLAFLFPFSEPICFCLASMFTWLGARFCSPALTLRWACCSAGCCSCVALLTQP